VRRGPVWSFSAVLMCFSGKTASHGPNAATKLHGTRSEAQHAQRPPTVRTAQQFCVPFRLLVSGWQCNARAGCSAFIRPLRCFERFLQPADSLTACLLPLPAAQLPPPSRLPALAACCFRLTKHWPPPCWREFGAVFTSGQQALIHLSMNRHVLQGQIQHPALFQSSLPELYARALCQRAPPPVEGADGTLFT
jgi:hypothetical protein